MNIADDRAFLEMLAQVNHGNLVAQLSEKMRELVAAIEDANAAGQKAAGGTLTLKLSIKRDDDMIALRPEVSIKVPKPVLPKSIFYATPDNNLTRQDPRQREMDLKVVSVPNARIVNAD